MRMTKSLHSWTTSQPNPVMSWWRPGIMRCSWTSSMRTAVSRSTASLTG